MSASVPLRRSAVALATALLVVLGLASPATAAVSTSISLSAAPVGSDDVVLDSVVTATAGTPAGTVEFFELVGDSTVPVGQAALINGRASVVVAAVEKGVPHTYTSQFTPSNTAAYDPAYSDYATVIVPAPSTTVVTVDPESGQYGEARTVQVAVSSRSKPVALGYVTIAYDDTTKRLRTASDGTVSLTLPRTLSGGVHDLSAEFEGTDAAAPSTGSGSLEVAPAGTSVKATFPKKSGATLRGTLVVTVIGAPLKPGGTIDATSGRTDLGSFVVRNGKASVVLTGLAVGKRKLVFVLRATDDYLSSTAKATVTVR